jgi:cobalt/nickel transport system ATP-binding protein
MTAPAIRVTSLTFRYPDGTKALDDVSLEIAAGERVALLGANGAGKSTLLLCLNGLQDPGTCVEIGGLPVIKKNIQEARRRVGLVFQNPDDQLFCPTLFDDISFGPRNLGLAEDEVLKRVHAALHAVGLAELEEKSSYHLSYGQKKRAALATVLAMEPEVLALDEPTAGLHPRARREMVALLKRQKCALVVATHDIELAKELCPRAIVMARGRKVADGEVAMVLADAKAMDDAELL